MTIFRIHCTAIAIVSMSVIALGAQEPASVLTANPPNASLGRVTTHLHPNDEIASLDVLLPIATIVVDCSVTAVLPSISRRAQVAEMIETHSLLSVREVLSGTIPVAARTIVLAQEGGNIGSQERLTDDPLVKVGERYVLFLAPDKRKEPVNSTGYPRYYIVGIWAGKAKIEGDQVKFPENAMPALKENNGTNATVFIAKLKDRINNVTMPSKRNPIPHPGLPQK